MTASYRELTGATRRRNYLEHLRRTRFNDPTTDKALVCLIKNFTLTTATICTLRSTLRY